jgi:hypothetical protein
MRFIYSIRTETNILSLVPIYCASFPKLEEGNWYDEMAQTLQNWIPVGGTGLEIESNFIVSWPSTCLRIDVENGQGTDHE